MFKKPPFQLTPYRSGDSLPVTIVPPPTITYRVVWEKPRPATSDELKLIGKIVADNTGRIQAFILAQRHNLNLGVEVTRRKFARWLGIAVTYTAAFGQEKTEVVVYPEEVIDELKELYMLVLYTNNRIAAFKMDQLTQFSRYADPSKLKLKANYQKKLKYSDWTAQLQQPYYDGMGAGPYKSPPQLQSCQLRTVRGWSYLMGPIKFTSDKQGLHIQSSTNHHLSCVHNINGCSGSIQSDALYFWHEPMFNASADKVAASGKFEVWSMFEDYTFDSKLTEFARVWSVTQLTYLYPYWGYQKCMFIGPDGVRYSDIYGWSSIGGFETLWYKNDGRKLWALPTEVPRSYIPAWSNTLAPHTWTAVGLAYPGNGTFNSYVVEAVYVAHKRDVPQVVYSTVGYDTGAAIELGIPMAVIRQQNGLDALEMEFPKFSYSIGDINNNVRQTLSFLDWSSSYLPPTTDNTANGPRLAIWPYMPNYSTQKGDTYYSHTTASNELGSPGLFSPSLDHTPYGDFPNYIDYGQNTNSSDWLATRPWLHASNGKHIVQGLIFNAWTDASFEEDLFKGPYTARLWCNRCEMSNVLAAALTKATVNEVGNEIPVTIDDVNAVILDVPLSYIKKLT